MIYRSILILLALFCFGRSGLAQAQDNPDQPPLLLSGFAGALPRHDYRLYRYIDDVWEQLPTTDMGWGVSPSPDGQWVVYMRVPPVLKAIEETMEEGDNSLYGSAWDLVLLNLRDGTEVIVAEQPPDVYESAGAIKRILPVWSPDGRMFAWTEQDFPMYSVEPSPRLMVYDMQTKTSRVVDNDVPITKLTQEGLPFDVRWGTTWLSVLTNDPEDGASTVRLYNMTTDERKIIRVGSDQYMWTLFGPYWVREVADDALSEVMVFSTDDGWYSLNPTTENVEPFWFRLEEFNALTPDESMRLIWHTRDSKWELVNNPKAELLSVEVPFNAEFTGFALGPSNQAASAQDDEMWIWKDGVATQIALPEGFTVEGLFWGPMVWTKGEAYSNG